MSHPEQITALTQAVGDLLQEARKQGASVHFEQVPEAVQAIARAARLEHLLP